MSMKEQKMSRRTFEVLCLGTCPVIFRDYETEPQPTGPSVTELNALLVEGFNSIEQPWRSRCKIYSSVDFREHPEIHTYGKMLFISDAEFQSGEYRSMVRLAGEGAGLAMVDVFEGTIGGGIGILRLLNGNIAPMVDGVQRVDCGWTVRCYHDFGFYRKGIVQ
jgi:hypothetical protein